MDCRYVKISDFRFIFDKKKKDFRFDVNIRGFFKKIPTKLCLCEEVESY